MSRHLRHARYAAALLSVVCCITAGAQTARSAVLPRTKQEAEPAVQDADLQQQLTHIAAAHHGVVALYARQLNTGKTVAIDSDTPVQTASTIKLALLWEVERAVALGKAQWSDKLTLQPGEPVPGSGMLHLLDTPLTLTLKDVTTLMIVISDNTATNLMIDRFPTAGVDSDMAALGLSGTWLYKKVMKPASGPMPADQPKFGLGKTTPRQIANLMERLGRCQLDLPNTAPLNPDTANSACNAGLTMLRNQFYRDGIPRYLEELDSSEQGSAIASKTGALDASRSDVALVAGKSGPIVLAIYTFGNADRSWTVENEGEITIAKLAQAIVKAWSPTGTDAKTLVPGLGLPAAPASKLE